MKVLWFTNTPSLAEEKFSDKPVGGGWIKSLEAEIKKQEGVELGIAFYHNIKMEPFKYKGTHYFPVYSKPKSKIKNLLSRINGALEPVEDINIFLNIIEEFKPDIIHVHGTEGPYGLIQKKVNKIPVVVSIQGNLIVYSYKYFSGFDKREIKTSSYLKDRLLFKTYYSQYKLFLNSAEREGKIMGMSKNIIGRTDWDRRISSIQAPGSKYFHTDEILRNSFYKEVWDNKLSDTLEIFTTTGGNPFKGIEVVLRAANLLDNLNFKFKWHIAGLTRKDKLVSLAVDFCKIKLSENIVFEGILTEQSLVEGLINAHLYVMPSHIENSPNSLCEAMLLGMPCIASDAGGTSSLLTNAKEGILIQDGDPWSLAGAIVELQENYEMARTYGNKAREKALKRHKPQKIVNDLLENYRKILSESKNMPEKNL